jgi:hypothetical protein
MAKTGRLSVTVLGTDGVKAAFDANAKLATRCLASGIYLGCNNLMTQSKAATPVKLGILRGSGYVTLPEYTNAGPVVELGFGGPASAYAVAVHETESSHPQHGGHNCNGDWKFLERPVAAARPTLFRFIGRVAAQQFRAGKASMPAGSHPKTPWEG